MAGEGKLSTEPRLADPDGFYETLIRLHDGLDEEQSRLVNARLVFLLANHIGDMAILREAMRLAREDVQGSGDDIRPP